MRVAMWGMGEWERDDLADERATTEASGEGGWSYMAVKQIVVERKKKNDSLWWAGGRKAERLCGGGERS